MESKIMPHRQASKTCQNCKSKFIIEPEDFKFYQKINVPEPTFCPECRQQRRLIFRNERNLYKRKCDLCDKETIGRYSPDSPSGWKKLFKVYCSKCWYSDKWDPIDYGRDYDFSRSFFSQFRDLIQEAPHLSLSQSNSVKSEWINYESDDKNCYLNVGGGFNEDSAYSTYLGWSNDCFDNYFVVKSSFCYESIFCHNCYKVFFSEQCYDCQNVILSYDCKNCSSLIGCIGLRHKKYHIFNQPYSKEEYFKFLEKYPVSSYQNLQFLKKKAKKNILEFPHKYAAIDKSINCSGNYIRQGKNCLNCWEVEDAEDSKHVYIGGIKMKECYDISSLGLGVELLYECQSGAMGGYNNKFGLGVYQSRNTEYCFETEDCHDCFGCRGLRKKSYYILNKQYSESEYKKLKAKIIQRMKNDKEYGEFFPAPLSPFGYNESSAQDYYPLSKKEALKIRANWNDYRSEINHKVSDYQISDDIRDIKDDVLKKILKCEKTDRIYRIIPMELKFYRKMGLPIPRRSPLQRHRDKLDKIGPRKLYYRQCQCAGNHSDDKIYQNQTTHPHHKEKHCPNEFQTSYAPERSEIVYCEKCYQKEVE